MLPGLDRIPGSVVTVGDYCLFPVAAQMESVWAASTPVDRSDNRAANARNRRFPSSLQRADRLRAPGSLGNSSFAAKVMKGMRMGGHMGVDRIKVRRLQVIKIFPDQNIILIKGAVPGHKGAYVVIEK